jgi:hypothetical protein
MNFEVKENIIPSIIKADENIKSFCVFDNYLILGYYK